MNSYNYNNNFNNQNQMPTNHFFLDFLQDMYNNDNNGWINGSNFNDNNQFNNVNNVDNNTIGLSHWELKRYHKLLNKGIPRHKALSIAKSNLQGPKGAQKRKSEFNPKPPPKRTNLVIPPRNTDKSNRTMCQEKPSTSKPHNVSTENKNSGSRDFSQKPKTTGENKSKIEKSNSSKTSNVDAKSNSTENTKKNNVTSNKHNSSSRYSQKPKEINSETNGAKINDKMTTKATTSHKNITPKQTSTTASKPNLNKGSSSNSNNKSSTLTSEKTNEKTSTGSKEQGDKNSNNTAHNKTIRIGVMAKGFPNVVLDQEELEELEEAIVHSMANGWTSKLIFDGIVYRPGVLLIECGNHKTASWLTLTIKNLPNWRGVDLEARFGYDMPEMKFITVYLPKASNRNDDFLMNLLAAQNECLNTKLWKIFCSVVQGQGKLMTIGVDDLSFESIKKCDFLLRYRFGKIMVHTQTPGNISNDQTADENAANNHSISEDFELDEEDLNGIEECFLNIKTEKPD